MEHFRGTDAVENFEFELVLPGVEDFRGQSFSGRYAHANGRKIHAAARSLHFPQDRGVKCWNGEENSRLVTRHHLNHVRDGGALRIQQSARTC